MAQEKVIPPRDVKKKYLSSGERNKRKIEKAGKGKSESTRLGRTYIAIPPAEGWPGGLPEKNGYKPGGK